MGYVTMSNIQQAVPARDVSTNCSLHLVYLLLCLIQDATLTHARIFSLTGLPFLKQGQTGQGDTRALEVMCYR